MTFDKRAAFLALSADERAALCDDFPQILWHLTEEDVLRARWKAASARSDAAFEVYLKISCSHDAASSKTRNPGEVKLWLEREKAFKRYEALDREATKLFDRLMRSRSHG